MVVVHEYASAPLVFEAPQVLERVAKLGDLFAPALTLQQPLPDGPRVATKKRPPRARVEKTPKPPKAPKAPRAPKEPEVG